MCLYLAGRGHAVAIHYNEAELPARELAREIVAAGGQAVVLQADLLDPVQTHALVSRAAEALGGPLTVLVNNASIFEYDRLGTVTPESWDRHVGSNLQAPVLLTQEFGAQVPEPEIDDRGEPRAGGVVVNMVDQRVRKLTPHFMSYTLAKMGLWAFTRTAAQALAPRVRVNAIGPGPTMQGHRQSEEQFLQQRASTLLGRGANPEDIVAALGYFLDAPAVTGQLLCVDGGQHLAWQTPDILTRE